MEQVNETTLIPIKRKLENQDQEAKKKKKGGRKSQNLFEYGNYSRYYGYRVNKQEIDPRIYVLRREWFHSKKCLDIGCNNGKFTCDIANHFKPSSILGIDIDELLIKQGNDLLTLKIKKKLEKEAKKKANPWPISFALTFGPLEEYYNDPYPENVSFISANYLDYEDNQKYDCISCFSTSKWIHFNWGDDGIKKLFQKVYDSLSNEGVFILEPQQWLSYQKKKTLTPRIKENVKNIKLKPDDFPEYLTKNLKFTLEKTMHIKDDGNHKKSFVERPIYLFRKNI